MFFIDDMFKIVMFVCGVACCQEDVPFIEKETRRLAIVNMDWSHVKVRHYR